MRIAAGVLQGGESPGREAKEVEARDAEGPPKRLQIVGETREGVSAGGERAVRPPDTARMEQDDATPCAGEPEEILEIVRGETRAPRMNEKELGSVAAGGVLEVSPSSYIETPKPQHPGGNAFSS